MLRDEDVGLSLAVRLGKAGACELAAWCMASHDYAFREAVPQELCLNVMEGETPAQQTGLVGECLALFTSRVLVGRGQ